METKSQPHFVLENNEGIKREWTDYQQILSIFPLSSSHRHHVRHRLVSLFFWHSLCLLIGAIPHFRSPPAEDDMYDGDDYEEGGGGNDEVEEEEHGGEFQADEQGNEYGDDDNYGVREDLKKRRRRRVRRAASAPTVTAALTSVATKDALGGTKDAGSPGGFTLFNFKITLEPNVSLE